MNKKVKNIIMTVISLLLIVAIVFTVKSVNNNDNHSMNNIQMNGSMENMQTPPDKTNGDENKTSVPEKLDGEGNQSNMQTPPDKPNGDENKTGVPEKPEGEGNQSNMQTPPDKPNGDENKTGVPEKPEGEGNQSNMQTPPDKPNGDENKTIMANQNNETITLGKYYVFLTVESLLLCLIIIYLIQSKFNNRTFKETYDKTNKLVLGISLSIVFTFLLVCLEVYIVNHSLNNENNNQNDFGRSSSNISYSAKNEITENTTLSDIEYSSSTSDENALSVSGKISVNMSNITVNKTGDSDGGDNTSFYGTNSAIIAKDGATLTLENINVNTDANGANGVFSYGGSATTNNTSSDGTTINISDSTIITKSDASGGIMTTGGGITNASNLTIETSGTSSAAIRSDRGGGTVNVDGGTYTTNGKGSPSIYSTANITVKNAKLVSNVSEGIIIEGKNYVSIENTELIDTNNSLNGQSTSYKNIFLYQSMSGDADDGISEFVAKNSKITTNKGDSFYVTNTSAKITLTNNTINNTDSDGNFLRIKADAWGNSGSNGGNVTLVMNEQDVNGNIVVDSISTLDMTMNNSTYKGKINSDNSAKSISLTIDKSSKLTLTGNSYVTSLTNEDKTNSNIDYNGYKLYVNGKSIN